MRAALIVGIILIAAAAPALAGEALGPADLVKAIRGAPQYQHALQIISRDHERLIADNIALTEIPAPPFKGEVKAKAYLGMLREIGLSNLEVDAEGNVIGLRKGKGSGPPHFLA